MQIRRKIPAAIGTEQWPLKVQWFSLNTSLVTSVAYFSKDLCTCSSYCSFLFELFIFSKNYFTVRCKLDLCTELKIERKISRERKRVLLEIFRPLFFSGFEIEFNCVFPTKLFPPLPQKSLEIQAAS